MKEIFEHLEAAKARLKELGRYTQALDVEKLIKEFRRWEIKK